MKRRIITVVLITALILSFVPLCHGESTPLLYRVTDENGNRIYLFGTIHVGNEALYPLPDAVLKAFDECSALAVELDLLYEMENPAELLKYSMDIYYTDGTKASDVLGEALVIDAAKALKMDRKLLDAMKPHEILSLLEEKAVRDALLDSGFGVDMYLMRRARERGMEIHALETVAQQFAIMHGMSDSLAAYQIDMYVHFPQQAALSTLMLLDAWKTGNLTALRQMLESESDVSMLPESLGQEVLSFHHQMYAERDERFTQQAQAFLAQGETVFFAVGAAHVAGKNGIADQLKHLGYTVEEMSY